MYWLSKQTEISSICRIFYIIVYSTRKFIIDKLNESLIPLLIRTICSDRTAHWLIDSVQDSILAGSTFPRAAERFCGLGSCLRRIFVVRWLSKFSRTSCTCLHFRILSRSIQNLLDFEVQQLAKIRSSLHAAGRWHFIAGPESWRG